MKPVDYRNETFEQVKARVVKVRAAVLDAWRRHGPCTTEELAARSGISILTLRPRTTELYQLGFVVLAGPQTKDQGPKTSAGGVYRAVGDGEAEFVFNQRRRAALKTQLELEL